MTPERASRILDNLKQVQHCPAKWSEMEGDERVRFCSICQKNVYSVANMTREEAEQAVMQAGGRLCMRMYRRPDGTILTRDCGKAERVWVKWTAVLAPLLIALGIAATPVFAGGAYSAEVEAKYQAKRIAEYDAQIAASTDPEEVEALKGLRDRAEEKLRTAQSLMKK